MVMLEVFIMNCVICLIIVKKVLENVDGVKFVKVLYDIKLVLVIFDDEKVIIKVFIDVIMNVGYLFKKVK